MTALQVLHELAGEVTSELQVVGKAASIAIQTWVRNNDKTKARAEEREKNIGWIKRLFTAWRVSHAERRAEREEAGEEDSEEDETPQLLLVLLPRRRDILCERTPLFDTLQNPQARSANSCPTIPSSWSLVRVLLSSRTQERTSACSLRVRDTLPFLPRGFLFLRL